ncbi:MAG TPA: hypothetical protein VKB07_11705 [Gaiellaceae bacterium]|nr:hypothetical protein [Gaiellaceae bacterium]
MAGAGLRFVLEAGFLIALAVAAGFAELSPTTIVLVMAAAWLLVAVIEWLAWREAPRMTRAAREEPAAAPAPAEPLAVEPEPEPRRRFWRRRRAEPEPAGEDTQDLPPPEQQPAPVSVEDRGT